MSETTEAGYVQAEGTRPGGSLDVKHLDGIDWGSAPVPRRWHNCWAQTLGWRDLDKIERCACGAIRHNDGPWFERNSRRRSAR